MEFYREVTKFDNTTSKDKAIQIMWEKLLKTEKSVIFLILLNNLNQDYINSFKDDMEKYDNLNETYNKIKIKPKMPLRIFFRYSKLRL